MSCNLNPQANGDTSPYALTTQDYEWLRRSTITPEIAGAEFVELRRVDNIDGAAIVGQKLKDGRHFSGIVFPYFSLEGRKRAERLRRDYPDLELRADSSHKEVGKYLSAPGRSNLLYFPMIRHVDDYCEWLSDLSLPVVFVEGEKKALCLMRIALERLVSERPAFLPIGLSGVWNWKGTIGKTTSSNGERVDERGILNDLYRIPFQNRKVVIFYDSNVRTNESANAARSQFSYRLRDELDAEVYFAEMPPGSADEGLNGPDDLAYKHGDEAVITCLERQQPAFKPTRPKPESYEDRVKRGNVLRQEVAKAAAINPSEYAKQRLGVKTWKQLASLWSQAGRFESEERDLLFTLHAMAEDEASDRSEFDFYYLDLYRLLYPCNGSEIKNGKLSSAARQKVRRRFDRLITSEDM